MYGTARKGLTLSLHNVYNTEFQMAATMIDENLEQEELDVAQLEEAEQPEQPEQEAEVDDIPEKYRGKSVKDLVQMHQEAEKAIGKKG